MTFGVGGSDSSSRLRSTLQPDVHLVKRLMSDEPTRESVRRD